MNKLLVSAIALMAAVSASAADVADFTHAAVTDLQPGALLPVTELEVEGESPYLWYAAKPGTYAFVGDADGDGLAQYDVTVKEAGFYRFRNPGMRFRMVSASAPIALWFGSGSVFFRPVRPDARLWYAPPDWHVHLDSFPAERAEEYVRKTGCAFLSDRRFWHVGKFPAPSAKAKPLAANWSEERIAQTVDSAAFAKPRAARRVVLFNNAFGYRHGGALEAGPIAFAKAAGRGLFSLEVVTNLTRLADAAFLARFDAIVLNSTSGVEESRIPGVSRTLTDYVAGGKGLALLHAAVDAFYESPEVQKMNGALLWGHPWAAPGTWSFTNEQKDDPVNAPFAALPQTFAYSDEIYQFSTPPFDRANCKVLLSVNMDDVLTAAAVDRWKSTRYGREKWRADRDHVVSFTKTYGRGRVFYTSFGHDARAFCDARFAHMVLGLQWTLGDL